MMRLKSYTLEQLQQAAIDGYRIFELKTGSSRQDDVLYGHDGYEVTGDIMVLHDLKIWPEKWKLREMNPQELNGKGSSQ